MSHAADEVIIGLIQSDNVDSHDRARLMLYLLEGTAGWTKERLGQRLGRDWRYVANAIARLPKSTDDDAPARRAEWRSLMEVREEAASIVAILDQWLKDMRLPVMRHIIASELEAVEREIGVIQAGFEHYAANPDKDEDEE